MKRTILFSLAVLLFTSFSFNAMAQWKKKKTKDAEPKVDIVVVNQPLLKDNIDTVSYIIGADVAKSFRTNSITINEEVFIRGFKAGISKTDTLFTEEEIGTIMQAWQMEMSAKRQKKTDSVLQINKKAGEAYLAENKTKPGVVELPSGLQYKVIKEGAGDSPTDKDVVQVLYTGTLIDGTKFDSSRDRNEPAEFPVNGVIPGWTEGLKLMKPGAVWMLYIPSNLAYGDHKTGPIAEGSTLIFEVELLKVEKK